MRLWSNLYKQYNVREKEEGIRIIDSNEMVQEKLAELAKKLHTNSQSKGQEFTEGFSQGLTAEAVVPLINPEEEAQQLKEEAEEYLADAKQEAQSILADAKEKSKTLREEAKKKGYQEGYQTGADEARKELEDSFQKKEEELNQHKLTLQGEYNRKLEELEPELLGVIIQVVEKVFHIQFDDKAELLLHLIQNAILNIENSRSFHVRVGDEQRLFLEKHKEDILDRVGHDISLDILSDPLLEGNQCVIETESGVFDCSLGVQLENLIKDLRSLSS